MPVWMDPWPSRDSGCFSLTRWMKVPNHTEFGVRKVRKQKHVFLILEGEEVDGRVEEVVRWAVGNCSLPFQKKAPKEVKEDLKNTALWGEGKTECQYGKRGWRTNHLSEDIASLGLFATVQRTVVLGAGCFIRDKQNQMASHSGTSERELFSCCGGLCLSHRTSQESCFTFLSPTHLSTHHLPSPINAPNPKAPWWSLPSRHDLECSAFALAWGDRLSPNGGQCSVFPGSAMAREGQSHALVNRTPSVSI